MLISNFNTSHVTVYRLSLYHHSNHSNHFNTSHVTVYLYYISIAYFFHIISIHLMLLFIIKLIIPVPILERFQYISCYCLSTEIPKNLSDLQEFQYISCYCLSVNEEPEEFNDYNFNTSHVTVYRQNSKNSISL